MDLSKIKPAEGSVKKDKTNRKRRRFRTWWNFHTRTQRSQVKKRLFRKIGFEGGQMPLYRRIPKFGFKNINRKEYRAINLETLQKLADDKDLKTIDLQTLINNGF
jgi:large subunit ribosomal protein L15